MGGPKNTKNIKTFWKKAGGVHSILRREGHRILRKEWYSVLRREGHRVPRRLVGTVLRRVGIEYGGERESE